MEFPAGFQCILEIRITDYEEEKKALFVDGVYSGALLFLAHTDGYELVRVIWQKQVAFYEIVCYYKVIFFLVIK